MDLSELLRIKGRNLGASRPVKAKTAIKTAITPILLITVLSAGFYIMPTTTTEPPTASNIVATAQPEPTPLALDVSQVAVQHQPTPQRVPGYFPDDYVNQGKNENGNVMTYEHD